MKRLTIFLGGLAIVLGTCGMTAIAQEAQAPTNAPNVQKPQRERLGRRMMRQRARMRMFGALRQLNLSDAQKQQAQSIIRSNFDSTKAHLLQ